jgi:hypothetical protein
VEALWKTVNNILVEAKSDSSEKIKYIEEVTSNLHPDFHVVHYFTAFHLAKSYYNLAVKEIELTNYKEGS